MIRFRVAILGCALALAACQKGSDDKKAEGTETPPAAEAPAPEVAKPPSEIPAPPDVAAAPADAQKTESGLAYKVLSDGPADGQSPGEWDKVKVNYTGWTTDGKMFDSSVTRGQPAEFELRGVIPGWTEGLQLMSVGDKFRFWIPEALAYAGRPGAPAGILVFEVELLEVSAGPKPIAPPEDVAAAPKDAKNTKSGLAYKVLTKGTGKESPEIQDAIQVHYTGWTAADGKMFDSSVMRERPASMPVKNISKGWTEGIQLMKVGDKYRFWIPEALAYEGKPGAPKGMVVFEVELLDIRKGPKPIPAPKDVAAPPKDAKKTELGVSYKQLSKGKGTEKPAATSTVEVHYTGWTTDGNMFDSSVSRGSPATFPLDRVIPGWTDGLQQMTEGSKFRFWIPEEMAYKGQPGRPQGMLVFDVELIDIKASPQ